MDEYVQWCKDVLNTSDSKAIRARVTGQTILMQPNWNRSLMVNILPNKVHCAW